MEARYIKLNARAVPVKAEGESDTDFQARMAWFRKHDRRVPIAGFGMPNLGFGVSYSNGAGVIGNTTRRPVQKWDKVGDDYSPTGQYIYDPRTYGAWSLKDSGFEE